MENSIDSDKTNQSENWANDIKILLFDQDNTTSDFIGFAVPSYEAMAKEISQRTKISEPKVIEAMQKVYVKRKTIEYEGVVQDMAENGFFDNVESLKNKGNKIDPKKIAALALRAQKVFSQTREKHLQAYPDIEDVFRKAQQKGLTNDILTDATSFQAKMRVKHTNLAPYVDTVFARTKEPTPNLDKTFQEKESRGAYDVPFKVVEIEEEKPDTKLDELLKMTREEISRHVCIIGDNDDRDMELARIWKCRGILAVYGRHDKDSDLSRRISNFSPRSVLARNASIVTKSRPDRSKDNSLIKIAKTPADITRILNLQD